MEDFSQQPADNELTPTSKKRSREFFMGWLRRRHLPLDIEDGSVVPKEAEDKKGSEVKKSAWNSLRSSLRNPFKKQVEVNYISDSEEGARKSEIPKAPNKSRLFENQFSRNTNTGQAQGEFGARRESTAPNANNELSDRQEEIAGFLPISEDARRRYDEVNPTEYINHDEKADIQLPSSQVRTGSETTNVIGKTRIVNESIDHPILPTNELALSTGEILRRKRERQLKKQVKELKKNAISSKNEQQVVTKQQQEFQRHLDEQDKLYKKIRKEQKPEVKDDHQELWSKTEQTVQPAKVEVEKVLEYKQPPLGQEATLPELPELQPDRLKTMVSSTRPEKPELILQTVEKAAERNVAIENLYERRHETKDEPDNVTSGKPSASSTGQLAVNRLRKNGFYYSPPAMMPVSRPESISQAKPTPVVDGGDMYKRAALNGFWTAIIICILLLILIVAR